MRFVDVDLFEIFCVSGNVSSWPDRVLFAFAVQAGEQRRSDLVGPCWMLDGQSIGFRPGRRLFSGMSPTGAVALAVQGVDVRRKRPWEKKRCRSVRVLDEIDALLEKAGEVPEVGTDWKAGLDAINLGLGRLVPPCDAETIFAFSKVYRAAERPQEHSLCHAVSDRDGCVQSRYKLRLSLSLRGQAESGADLESRPG